MSKVETDKSYQQPDERGHFGPYGGRFVPETLMHPIDQLIAAYEEAKDDPAFHNELNYLLANYVGRPTPLMFAQIIVVNLSGRGDKDVNTVAELLTNR